MQFVPATGIDERDEGRTVRTRVMWGARSLRRFEGPVSVLLGAVVAGLGGLVTTWAVSRWAGPADYAVFGAFWSATFLLIGCLAGVQQEITRATATAAPARRAGARGLGTLRLVLGIAALAALFIVGSFTFWGPRAFGNDHWALFPALLFAVLCYVPVALVNGSLAGSGRWRALGAMFSMDALLRLLCIGICLALGGGPIALAWAIALPIPVALAIVLLGMRDLSPLHRTLAEGARTIFWNVLRTMIASVGSAILVTGFPVMLTLFANGTSKAVLGTVILAITITRAPLLMPLSAFQSYLVVFFHNALSRARQWRSLLALSGLVAAAAVVLAWAGSSVGPQAFQIAFGSSYKLAGPVLGLLVLGGGSVALLYLSGPFALARNRHGVYAAGWLTATVVALLLLTLDLSLPLRASLSLCIGPLVGFVVHIAGLLATGGKGQEET